MDKVMTWKQAAQRLHHRQIGVLLIGLEIPSLIWTLNPTLLSRAEREPRVCSTPSTKRFSCVRALPVSQPSPVSSTEPLNNKSLLSVKHQGHHNK